ncbi:hypothetical protein ACFPIJ_41780 [Dactylosporangium cerinum]|uniref:Uncharacterized protein n=1 Tax=Dactylosporangium cerinum TaxID=1434730 RepID=A0ABV9WA29_9ACTN
MIEAAHRLRGQPSDDFDHREPTPGAAQAGKEAGPDIDSVGPDAGHAAASPDCPQPEGSRGT